MLLWLLIKSKKNKTNKTKQKKSGERKGGCLSSPCFSGSSCMETDAGGFRCGPCPKGFIGDGRTCTPGLTCADRPCFPGTSFSFFLTTFIRIVFICLFHYLFIYFLVLVSVLFFYFSKIENRNLNSMKQKKLIDLIWLDEFEIVMRTVLMVEKKFLRVKQFNKNLHSGLNLIDWFDHQKNSFNLTM